jgi:hypothetical protein
MVAHDQPAVRCHGGIARSFFELRVEFRSDLGTAVGEGTISEHA